MKVTIEYSSKESAERAVKAIDYAIPLIGCESGRDQFACTVLENIANAIEAKLKEEKSDD